MAAQKTNRGVASRLSAIKNRIAPAGKRVRRLGRLMFGLLLLAGTFYFGWSITEDYRRPQWLTARLCVGDKNGRRYEIAPLLKEAGRKNYLNITICDDDGAMAGRKLVAEHKADMALTQGNVPLPNSIPPDSLCQVAGLIYEPLHLLVKPQFAGKSLRALRGRRLNISKPASGTHLLSLKVLECAGMLPGRDFTVAELSYDTLRQMSRNIAIPLDRLPDGVFTVSLMPSPIAKFLVEERGYRLMEIPFAQALTLKGETVQSVAIPAYSYQVDPPIPDHDIHTIGTRLLLIARKDASSEVVERMIKTVFADDFARQAILPGLDETTLATAPEMQMHPGARTYLDRNKPLITNEILGLIVNMAAFLLTATGSVSVLSGWWRRRRSDRFETYLHWITDIEETASRLNAAFGPDRQKLQELSQELSAARKEVVEKLRVGKLQGSDQMCAHLLAMMHSARNYLDGLLAQSHTSIASLPEQTPKANEA